VAGQGRLQIVTLARQQGFHSVAVTGLSPVW
jgi:hypothetical protein